jgi:hypothetical protein
MDETFQLRARRLLGEREPAPLDFSLLTAALAAERAASAAVRAQLSAPPAAAAGAAEGEPIVELVLAGPDWPRAARAQRGCFNRAESIRRRNTP